MFKTLPNYIGRRFIFWFFIVFGAMLAIVSLFETIELLRRAAGREEADFEAVVIMALMKIPFTAEKITVFGILFGAMATFWQLTRSQELIVVRAIGMSAWQFMMPLLVITFLFGIFKIVAFNPFAAATLARFDQMEAKILRGESSILDISTNGLWLRQQEESGNSVIHALRVEPDSLTLHQVIVFSFSNDGDFLGRLDGSKAKLHKGYWHVENVWQTGVRRPPVYHEELQLATNLTLEKIQDSFAPPETMSFWDLPAFIDALEASGFTALRHRLHLHRILAGPILLCSMVLIAATFSLRTQRRGGTLSLIVLGIVTGFLLYFFTDLVFALGLSGSIPLVLAAWAPAIVCVMLGTAMLFHTEDG